MRCATSTPGLLLRVSDIGLKVFYVSKRVSGRMRRFKIGPYLPLALARSSRYGGSWAALKMCYRVGPA